MLGRPSLRARGSSASAAAGGPARPEQTDTGCGGRRRAAPHGAQGHRASIRPNAVDASSPTRSGTYVQRGRFFGGAFNGEGGSTSLSSTSVFRRTRPGAAGACTFADGRSFPQRRVAAANVGRKQADSMKPSQSIVQAVPMVRWQIDIAAHFFERPADTRVARQARAAVGRPLEGGDDDGHGRLLLVSWSGSCDRDSECFGNSPRPSWLRRGRPPSRRVSTRQRRSVSPIRQGGTA